jgi:hypothetical protein
MIEADSNGNEDALPRQYTRVSNATFVQRSTVQGGNAILLRGGTDYALLNSVVTGPQACLDIDETGGTTTRAAMRRCRTSGRRSSARSCCLPDGLPRATTMSPWRDRADLRIGLEQQQFRLHDLADQRVRERRQREWVTATDPTTFNADSSFGTDQPNTGAPNRLEAVTFIGAVRNAQDTNFAGWTCNSGYVSFGSNSGSCTALPTT